MSMTIIKNIIFDVGMVLVNFRYKEYLRELGFSEELENIFCQEIIENPLWGELDKGIRETEEIIIEMKSRVANYPDEADLFFDNIHDIVETYPYAVPWMEELKQKGLRIYLLSNYPKELFDMHSKGKFTFMDTIDGKIVSGFVKLVKPDPAIYRLLLDTYDLRPEECVFLDDRKENIEAAKKLGMHTILFQNYEQAKSLLDQMISMKKIRK